MSIAKKLMVQPVAGSVAPVGVDFDGTNDYLSKSTDLTGNADGKTFTFSAWVYRARASVSEVVLASGSRFIVGLNGVNNFYLNAYNSGGGLLLNATLPITNIPNDTFIHILCSIDLANTANRYVYLNDVNYTASVTWSTYTNADIDFTNTVSPYWTVGNQSTVSYLKGRLAHVFLDYTYRDLSNAANRRLFIDADLKPAANQASLSPILYLPMTDADTAHVNEGTGGDFTPNGTFATSQRGPNQDNCVASDFDGSADYLSRNGITGISDGKEITFSVDFTLDTNWASGSNYHRLIAIANSSGGVESLSAFTGGSGSTFPFRFTVKNSSGTNIINVLTANNAITVGRKHSVQVVFDTSVSNKIYVYVDGVSQTLTINTFTLDGIGDYTNTITTIASWGGAVSLTNGSVGELYFDTTYTDLSTNNPFWDADANRPKPVRQVLEETGNTPLIAMPIEASNAGLNLGTGGNFTVNSGPYTGARGGSEYWARSMDTGISSSNYLQNSSLALSSLESATIVVALKNDKTNYNAYYLLDHLNNNGIRFELVNRQPTVTFYETSGPSNPAVWYGNTAIPAATDGLWYVFQICVSSSNANTNNGYVNGSLITKAFADIQTGATITATGQMRIGANLTTGIESSLGFVYVAPEFVDFSQEANRLKFVDAFGYPIDLQPAIDAGDIPNPLVYMKFDDPSNLGLNSGTGGNFTVNGTVTAGADVDPNA